MTVRVALLRGVNLNGRKVTMAELKAELERQGFAPVKTHLASGNVVLEAGELSDAATAEAVAVACAAVAGFAPSVVVRSAAELRRALSADPYPEAAGARMVITFLGGDPDPEGVRFLEGWRDGPERCRVIGREAFAHFPQGQADSKLAVINWSKRLGAEATGRNRNTVEKLAEIAEAMAS